MESYVAVGGLLFLGNGMKSFLVDWGGIHFFWKWDLFVRKEENETLSDDIIPASWSNK